MGTNVLGCYPYLNLIGFLKTAYHPGRSPGNAVADWHPWVRTSKTQSQKKYWKGCRVNTGKATLCGTVTALKPLSTTIGPSLKGYSLEGRLPSRLAFTKESQILGGKHK